MTSPPSPRPPLSGSEPDDHAWMTRALELAGRAEALGEVPVGAVVVLDGEEVGSGFNQPISGTDPTAHAEIMALRDAAARVGNYRLNNASLYVTIEPCTMCAGALVHARIGRLVYGAPEPKAGAIRSRVRLLDGEHLNWKVSVVAGVMETQCSELISGFFARQRERRRGISQSD